MNARWYSLASVMVVLFLGACQTSSTTGQATTTAPAWHDDVVIAMGSELCADGSIVTGKTTDDFKPGPKVHLSIMVEHVPANTPVKVVWLGPHRASIGEETKNAAAGQKHLAFTSADSASWASGDYAVEISIGDRKVNTQDIRIE